MLRKYNSEKGRFEHIREDGLVCSMPSKTVTLGYRPNHVRISEMTEAGLRLLAARGSYDKDSDVVLDAEGRMHDTLGIRPVAEPVPVYNDRLGWISGFFGRVARFFKPRASADACGTVPQEPEKDVKPEPSISPTEPQKQTDNQVAKE